MLYLEDQYDYYSIYLPVSKYTHLFSLFSPPQ